MALDEYIKETDEIEKASLNKDELKNIIEQFEAAAEKIEILSWFIHE